MGAHDFRLRGPGRPVDGEVLLRRPMTPADGLDAQELELWSVDRPCPTRGSIVPFRTGTAKARLRPLSLCGRGTAGVSASGGTPGRPRVMAA